MPDFCHPGFIPGGASPYNTFSRKFGVFERFLLVYCVICKHLLVQIGLNRLY